MSRGCDGAASRPARTKTGLGPQVAAMFISISGWRMRRWRNSKRSSRRTAQQQADRQARLRAAHAADRHGDWSGTPSRSPGSRAIAGLRCGEQHAGPLDWLERSPSPATVGHPLGFRKLNSLTLIFAGRSGADIGFSYG